MIVVTLIACKDLIGNDRVRRVQIATTIETVAHN
jgi:hypothetical protein